MTNPRAGLLAVIALLLCGAACSKIDPPQELTALDNAYKSGVFTKDEYDARKARLDAKAGNLAALEKARTAGLLSDDEYRAKKSALLASNEPAPPAAPPVASTPVPLAAEAAQAIPSTAVAPTPVAPPPVIPTPVAQAPARSATPFLAQVQAPSAKSIPAASPAASGGDSHTYKMKLVKVMDAQGYASPIVSATMLIPLDWQSQGATTWNVKDSCNTTQTSLRASGPDGRAFEVFPGYAWTYADDPTFLRQAAAQKAQFGMHACDVLPPMSAADYVRQNIGKIRPNVKIASIEPAPKLMEILQQRAHQTEQAAAQYRLQQRVRPDVVKARLKYTLNGQPVEEWIIAATMITATLGPSYDPRTMRQTQAYSYSCYGSMVAERAPQGQLDSSEKFFDLINSTYHVDQAWQARITQGKLATQQIELKGIRDRSAIVTKNAEDIRQIQQQGYENRQKVQDQNFKGFDQVIRGVESYQNPNTGEKVELDSAYGHAWVNGNGTYLLSDQAGFNPNTVSQESWTPLQHVQP